jgi:hypothetical protein
MSAAAERRIDVNDKLVPYADEFQELDLGDLLHTLLPNARYEAVGVDVLHGDETLVDFDGVNAFMTGNAVDPLLATVHQAFDNHAGIVLTPDVLLHPLQRALVLHCHKTATAGASVAKESLRVRRDDFLLGSRDNDWPSVFAEFRTLIASRVSAETVDALTVDDLTTASTAMRAAGHIGLMQACEFMFDYGMDTYCGIPFVTLRGTAADWDAFVRKVETTVGIVGADDTTAKLVDVARKIANTAKTGYVRDGAPDDDETRHFWDSMYKWDATHLGSGEWPHVTGWLNVFYLYGGDGGARWTATDTDDGLPWGRRDACEFPAASLASAPLTWNCEGTDMAMRLHAGPIGTAYSAATNCVRCVAAWAVCHENDSAV